MQTLNILTSHRLRFLYWRHIRSERKRKKTSVYKRIEWSIMESKIEKRTAEDGQWKKKDTLNLNIIVLQCGYFNQLNWNVCSAN